jgi:hypothetical protein
MDFVLELKKQRFQFLEKLYEESKADPDKGYNPGEIYYKAGLCKIDTSRIEVTASCSKIMMEGTLNDVILSWYQSPKLKGIIKYLESEGLIKMDVGGWVIWITHEGIKEVEKLRDNPQTSTERFPPYQTIYYIGGNYSETGRVMGDVFRDIHNATIINKSLVENSFNKVKRERDEETSKALVKVAEFIEKSGDPASGALFDKFNEGIEQA